MSVSFKFWATALVIGISCKSRDSIQNQNNEVPIAIGDTPLSNNSNLTAGWLPKNNLARPEVLISRAQYVLSWNQAVRSPNWSAWTLQSANIGHSGRSGNFAVDEALARYLKPMGLSAVDPSEYKDSCFNKGHMTPSGDRTTSQTDNQATFFMSNMSPQSAFLNRGIWENLESHQRELVTNPSVPTKLQIYAGSIFPQKLRGIGPQHDIMVPAFSFKVIVPLNNDQSLKHSNPDIIVVKMPNVTSANTDPLDDHLTECDEDNTSHWKQIPDWTKYKVPLAEVENESGFTLLPE